MKIGDKIAANEQALNLWESMIQKNMAATTAFRMASDMVAEAQQEAFDLIRECHPELNGRQFIIRWKEKSMIIVE